MIKLTANDFSITAGKGSGRREISGVAVPYNVRAEVSSGQAVIIKPGALPVEGKAPRLFMYHDSTMPVGVVTERVDTPEGMMFTAKVSASSQGQDAKQVVLRSQGYDECNVEPPEAGLLILAQTEAFHCSGSQ